MHPEIIDELNARLLESDLVEQMPLGATWPMDGLDQMVAIRLDEDGIQTIGILDADDLSRDDIRRLIPANAFIL
jgi:hypothetical protein